MPSRVFRFETAEWKSAAPLKFAISNRPTSTADAPIMKLEMRRASPSVNGVRTKPTTQVAANSAKHSRSGCGAFRKRSFAVTRARSSYRDGTKEGGTSRVYWTKSCGPAASTRESGPPIVDRPGASHRAGTPGWTGLRPRSRRCRRAVTTGVADTAWARPAPDRADRHHPVAPSERTAP